MTEASLDVGSLGFLAALADPARRGRAATELAIHVGAEDLIVFIRDPDIDALLAAPGFRQTLPGAAAWRRFLLECTNHRTNVADVPWPHAGATQQAIGIAIEGAVLVLLGGAPNHGQTEGLRLLLPVLGAAFRHERTAQTASAQAAIARQNAAQTQQLAERLDSAHRALQQELRTREDFLASASHDLKNPLAAVRGIAQLLQRHVARSDSVDPGRLALGLSQISVTSGQMAGQIDELLEVTRFRMGRPLDLDLEPADMVSLTQRVIDQYRAATDQHSIDFLCGEESIVGRWDGARLERVVGNLMSNAIKYSPEGGEIEVFLATEGRDGGECAVLSVRDTGLGIPDGDARLVFDRFERGSNVVGRIAGTGIGLAAVKQIVEQHGGTVTVASVLGQGSTFTIRLPIGSGVLGAIRSRGVPAT